MTELPNTPSKEFDDAVGHAYKGEAAREKSEILKADLKNKAISDLARDVLAREQVADENHSNKRFAKAVEIFEREELGEDQEAETETTFEQKVETARAALVQQYEQYGAKPEDFSLIETQNEDGETVSTLVYSAKKGLDPASSAKEYDEKRSYNSVMADDESHILEINGKKIDTITGMTEEVHRAMIAYAKANNLPVPDSNDTKDKFIWTETWLTGEPADADDARVGGVNADGQAYVDRSPRDDDGFVLRFRPAVVIT